MNLQTVEPLTTEAQRHSVVGVTFRVIGSANTFLLFFPLCASVSLWFK